MVFCGKWTALRINGAVVPDVEMEIILPREGGKLNSESRIYVFLIENWLEISGAWF